MAPKESLRCATPTLYIKKLCENKDGRKRQTQCHVYFLSILTVQSKRWWKPWGDAVGRNRCSPKTCSYLLIKAIYWVTICHRVRKTNSTCLAARLFGDLHLYQPQASRLIACDRHSHDRLLSIVIFSSSSLCFYVAFRASTSLDTPNLFVLSIKSVKWMNVKEVMSCFSSGNAHLTSK